MDFNPQTDLHTLSNLFRYTWKVYKTQYQAILPFSVFLLVSLILLPILMPLSGTQEVIFILFWLLLVTLALLTLTIDTIWATEQTTRNQEKLVFHKVWETVRLHLLKTFGANINVLRDIILIRVLQEIFKIGTPYLLRGVNVIPVIEIAGDVFVIFTLILNQFVNQFAVLHQTKGRESQNRSSGMVRRYWWRANGISAIAIILHYGFFVLLSSIPFFTPDSFVITIFTLFPFTLPFFIIFRTLLFLNLEARQGLAPVPTPLVEEEILEPADHSR